MQPIGFPNSGYLPPKEEHTLTKSFAPEKAAALPPTFVTNIDPFKEVQNVFMQGKQPSCIAHGVTNAIMWHYWRKTGKFVKLSPRFIYALCKTVDGVPAADGTYLKTALEMAQKYGVCEDAYFPNDVNLDINTYTDAKLIPADAYQNAAQYRIDSFDLLADLSPTGLNTAIFNDGMGDIVMIGMKIGDSWWTDIHGSNSWSADSLLPLRPTDAQHPSVSGHCVNLYGFGAEWDSQNPSCWWLENWWSAEWAYQGRGCFKNTDLPDLYEAATLTANFANTSPAPEIPTVAHQVPSFIQCVENLVDEVKNAL